MNIRIREATPQDVAQLRELAHNIWHACYQGIISPEQIEYMLGWMYAADEVCRQMENGVIWELIEADQPVGFLSWHADPDQRVKLEKLYILPEMQGRGIGQTALRHVLEAANALGCKSVWLQVNKQNRGAITSYRKAGFEVVKEAVFEIGGGFVMDDYLMERGT